MKTQKIINEIIKREGWNFVKAEEEYLEFKDGDDEIIIEYFEGKFAKQWRNGELEIDTGIM